MTASMLPRIAPFQGQSGASFNHAASGASSRASVLPTPKTLANTGLRQVRLANLSLTDDVYIAWGDDTVVAAVATGMAIPHGDVEVITLGAATHIAFITGGAAVTVNVTPGEGV